MLSSLIDAKKFPAQEIRALYHERWEIELGYDEVKTDMLDRLEMEQIAAEADVEPSRVRFVMRLRLIRDEWAWAAASSSPGAIPKKLRNLRESRSASSCLHDPPTENFLAP